MLFVRSINETKQQASKYDWALFLTTDSQFDDEDMLEVYALRWGIEVYFKEAKHNEGAARVSEVRNSIEESLRSLNFASKLWGLFKALITGTLNEVISLTENDKNNVMEKIEQSAVNFYANHANG